MRLSGTQAIGSLPPLAETWRRAFVELLGAFTLVLVGAGTIMSLGPQTDAGTLEVALATGLAIAVMVSAVGHISGGHFNPAITFGFMLTRRISVLLGLVYWVAQLLGGVLAALLLRWIFPRELSGRREPRGALRFTSSTLGAALVLEAIGHVLPRLGRLRDGERSAQHVQRSRRPLHRPHDRLRMLLAYPLTGGSFNPARAFGPELVSGSWTDAWIWYVGPLAGGAIAALLYDELYLRPESPAAVGPPATGVEEPGPGGQAADR